MTRVIAPDDSNTIESFAMVFETKDKQDNVNNTINENDLKQLLGRVTQGSNETDFEYLQKNMDKKFAWMMGGDGLNLFLKQSYIQALRSLGGEDRWIRKRLELGRRFRLGVLYRSDQCVSATWDGVLSLIDKHYSKSISTKILRHVNALKSMSFNEIEAQARLSYLQGASYFDVNELPVNGFANDSRFMTEDRFMECEGTLEESRGFLYNRLGLTGLFDGSGFTKDSNGQLHVREYLQLNLPVRDLPGFRYLDISIDSNDLMPDA